ncbi:hypothetical protein RvY_15627 [Ramazzottius varieornatus]|uniref:Uncharacterized protein n=1 Tax=Ramazzottius varieornatus TaxID=947166 RepID=A0A1D1VX53_RAMVA|nr:hypothetical protein RvY_15627 [Ramazzottius varieornatus]
MGHDDPKSYEKLATMRAELNQKKSLLRELLKGNEEPPTPFRRLLFSSAICHTILGIGGAILLGVLGMTTTGGILTAWEILCAFVFWAAVAQTKYNFLQQASTRPSDDSLQKFKKLLFYITIPLPFLALATIIQAAVLLSNIATSNNYYYFYGPIMYMYIGLGSGNAALGLLSLIINLVLLKKLYDAYKNENAGTLEETQDTGLVVEQEGSVQQLAVADLTYLAANTEYSRESPVSVVYSYKTADGTTDDAHGSEVFSSKTSDISSRSPIYQSNRTELKSPFSYKGFRDSKNSMSPIITEV